MITLADVAVFVTRWTEGAQTMRLRAPSPASRPVSALTSRGPVSLFRHMHGVTSTATHPLPPPPPPCHPPPPSLQCHISIPHALLSRLRNASPAKAPARGAQFTMAGEKLSGPKSQRKTAEPNAALSPLPQLHLV